MRSTSSMPPHMKNACSGKWSNWPSAIASKDASVSDSGTGLLGGAGFGVTLAQNLHIRFEAQATTIDEDVLNARDDASALARIEKVRPILDRPDDPSLMRTEFYGMGFYKTESCTNAASRH